MREGIIYLKKKLLWAFCGEKDGKAKLGIRETRDQLEGFEVIGERADGNLGKDVYFVYLLLWNTLPKT